MSTANDLLFAQACTIIARDRIRDGKGYRAYKLLDLADRRMAGKPKKRNEDRPRTVKGQSMYELGL